MKQGGLWHFLDDGGGTRVTDDNLLAKLMSLYETEKKKDNEWARLLTNVSTL